MDPKLEKLRLRVKDEIEGLTKSIQHGDKLDSFQRSMNAKYKAQIVEREHFLRMIQVVDGEA